MMLVLRTILVGITYAVWPGASIVFVAIVGMCLNNQIPDIPAINQFQLMHLKDTGYIKAYSSEWVLL